MQQPPNVNVPPGYIEMLQAFTVSVLRSKPDDIISYAADYFSRLKSNSVGLDLSNSIGFRNKSLNSKNTKSTPDKNKSMNTDNHQNEIDIFQDEISPQINFDEEVEFPHSESDEGVSQTVPEIPLEMSRMRRKSVAAEPYNPDEADDEDSFEESSLPQDQRDLLYNVCKKIVLFKGLDEAQLNKIINVMTSRVVTPGEKVIEQGEDGDNFYIIESGIFSVSMRDESGENKKVFLYDNEGSFGELALMYNAPRSATVQAETEGRIWCMNRTAFRKLVLNHASKQRRTFLNLLHSVTVLQDLSPYERMNLADALVKRVYHDQECIIKEGEPGTEMYFVMDGVVIITQHDENDETKEIELAELTHGSYFGELALLSKSPRAASAFAKGETTIAVLDVDGFERLLGPCVDLLRRHSYRYSRGAIDTEHKIVC